MVTITVFVFIWHIILYIRQRLKRRCKPQEPINLKKKQDFVHCVFIVLESYNVKILAHILTYFDRPLYNNCR